MFSKAVQDKIGHYVYRLIDPRNGETFYVGKGQGNRLFMHIRGEIEADEEGDDYSLKQRRIREIRLAGLDVIHVLHRHNIPQNAVYEVEAALIDAYPGLANSQAGHYSPDRGPMNSEQVIAKYALPSVPDDTGHKLVLININDFENEDRGTVYEQVRYSWKISVKRATAADYILAVIRGVVVGAFVADEWLPSGDPRLNMPKTLSRDNRYGFNGRKADPKIWELYVGTHGKRIDNDEMRHVQNPIRYYNMEG